jgi:NAD(P)-dependent dehydrogenase (short-subunit alcohol dehydrogenase family)
MKKVHCLAPDGVLVNDAGITGPFHDLNRIEAVAGTPLYAASKAAINMMTARFARLLPGIRINVADPGMTATDLSGGQVRAYGEAGWIGRPRSIRAIRSRLRVGQPRAQQVCAYHAALADG